MGLLSKIQVGETIYDLKDAQARTDLSTILSGHAVEALGAAAWKAVAAGISDSGLVDAATVKNYVDAQVGAIHNFDVTIYESLPEASAETMYIIGLVEDTQASAGSYIEYITIKKADDTYVWEKIGSTKTDLTGYVSKDTTIATIKLDHNITAEELKTALGLKALAYKDSAAGTVAGQTIAGLTATGTTTGALTGVLGYTSTAVASTGSFTPDGDIAGTVTAAGTVVTEVETAATAATLTKADYTPAGSVTVTPATSTASKLTTAGTAASFTEGAFTPATLSHTEGTFATSGVNVSVDATDSEKLVISTATTGTASNITAFNGGAKAADKFTANVPAAFSTVNVVTGITSASFLGTKAENALVTGVSYQKAGEATSTFTGTETAIAADFTGKAATVSVSGNYDKANLGTVAFAGAQATFNVDDVVVAAKDVTVQ